MEDRYELIDYSDVCGNEEEGWEVNNVSRTGETIDITMGDGDEEVIKKLKEINYFRKEICEDDIYVEWNRGDVIELFCSENYMPICRLELIA